MLLALALAVQPSLQVITIDASVRTPVSPYIYGANHPDWKGIGINFPLARQGGNRMTAYNWETNASNAGNDYHHQNDGYVGETNEPGWTSRTFMDAAQQHGAAVLLTVPTNGYVSADKNADGDVNKTPNYLSVRFYKSFAKKPGGKFVYPPSTSDKAVYQDEFVAWIEKKKSPKTPVWFSLDNEPDLWHSTHERITPKKPGYADIIANNIEFASAIKAVASKALIFGPANYGWQGFRTFQDAPDAKGRDFLDVYLEAMKSAGSSKRLLDVLDIHWYPEAQGGEVRIAFSGPKETEETYEARIQAPRSLWDDSYVEKSWITEFSTKGQPIRLLPRVLSQIKAHYPGTKLAITEYDYGGKKHVSGLLAQADILGLFGRYGLFAACNWGISAPDMAQIGGFRAFLDYDGKGSKVGNLGLKVSGEEAPRNSVYAFLTAGKKLTIVALNKTQTSQQWKFSLKGLLPARAVSYVRDDKNLSFPRGIGTSISQNTVSVEAPARSVVTVEAVLK